MTTLLEISSSGIGFGYKKISKKEFEEYKKNGMIPNDLYEELYGNSSDGYGDSDIEFQIDGEEYDISSKLKKLMKKVDGTEIELPAVIRICQYKSYSFELEIDDEFDESKLHFTIDKYVWNTKKGYEFVIYPTYDDLDFDLIDSDDWGSDILLIDKDGKSYDVEIEQED